jgi:hypothetical protein
MEVAVAYLRYYAGIYTEHLRKITKSLRIANRRTVI